MAVCTIWCMFNASVAAHAPTQTPVFCHTCDVIAGCESRQTDSEGFCICNMPDKTEDLDVH